MISMRWHLAAISVCIVLLKGVMFSQQPALADIQNKTSGLIRVLASPGALGGAVVPGPLTDLERLLSDVGDSLSRGPALPRLDLFVQYEGGSEAVTGRIVPITPKVVASLAANDAVGAIELRRPPSFQREDVRPFNRNARLTHRVDEFIAKYPGFDGASRIAAVIDGGAVRSTHREFRSSAGNISRARLATMANLSTHATHVAGTIIAAGVDARAKGMAPAASVISLDFTSDLKSLADLRADELHVTNHSYGPVAGWDYHRDYGWLWWGDRSLSEDEDVTFGRYGARESTLDRLLHDTARGRWVAFVAAGNDRNDGPLVQPVSHYVYTVVDGALKWQLSERTRSRDGVDSGGVDTISGLCVAKNVLCIGAIEDGAPGRAFTTTSFSGWGPADDGRVKPDLVANGQNLLSTSDANDEAYLEMPGTSMASPTAAGIGLIIGQAFERNRRRPALGVDLKAVLIHSAIDAGRPGPDAEFGWGVINTLAAGDLVADPKQLIEAVQISRGPGVAWSLESTGDPIRITMVWNDPPGNANMGAVDDSSPALENDLDVELTAPDGSAHFPYRLDVRSPLANAKSDAPNRIDNVEMIDAPARQGVWQLRIRAHSLKQGHSQAATVILSGLQRR